jgi:hypothetical protein
MFVASFLTFMTIGGFPSFVEDMKVCCVLALLNYLSILSSWRNFTYVHKCQEFYYRNFELSKFVIFVSQVSVLFRFIIVLNFFVKSLTDNTKMPKLLIFF